MADIVKIVLKGLSGYCCVDEAYEEKISITVDSITYEYKPVVESEINPKRKWSYKTNSPIFKMKYNEITNIIPGIIEKGIVEFCTDIGGIEFNITYSDKTKFKKIYWVPGDYFKELFVVIKTLLPECEYTSAVLMTSEDFDGEKEN